MEHEQQKLWRGDIVKQVQDPCGRAYLLTQVTGLSTPSFSSLTMERADFSLGRMKQNSTECHGSFRESKFAVQEKQQVLQACI